MAPRTLTRRERFHRFKIHTFQYLKYVACNGCFYQISREELTQQPVEPNNPPQMIMVLGFTPLRLARWCKAKPLKLIISGCPGRWMDEEMPENRLPPYLLASLNRIYAQFFESQPATHTLPT